MYKTIALVMIGLMITDSNSDYLDDDDDSDKREKRRVQNVKAAQKSYRAKKQLRENLQQKNTELVETQMRLLHDKSRLQEQVMVLEKVMNSLNHIYKNCSNSNSRTSEVKAKTRAQFDVVNVNIGSPCDSSSDEEIVGQALDLSIGIKPQLSSCSDASNLPKRSGSSTGSTNALRTNERWVYCDESIFDESFLDVGATQEVILEPPMVSRKDSRASNSSDYQDDSVFIPSPKKNRSLKAPSARTLRRCATDVLKRERSTGINSCVS